MDATSTRETSGPATAANPLAHHPSLKGLSGMKGTTYKRCGCRDATGKLIGKTCPKLRRPGGGWNPTHGVWHLQIELPPRARAELSRRLDRLGGNPSHPFSRLPFLRRPRWNASAERVALVDVEQENADAAVVRRVANAREARIQEPPRLLRVSASGPGYRDGSKP